jgi:hypothetical protein
VVKASKRKQKEMEELVSQFEKFYHVSLQNATINFFFRPMKKYVGLCHTTDCKNFNILISSSLPKKRKIETAVHELVHVTQRHTKELSEQMVVVPDPLRWEYQAVWQGKPSYREDEIDEMPYEQYRELPWEKESYRVAESFVSQFYQ